MKIFRDGKIYDTDSAEVIATHTECSSGYHSGPYKREYVIYRTQKGSFLFGWITGFGKGIGMCFGLKPSRYEQSDDTFLSPTSVGDVIKYLQEWGKHGLAEKLMEEYGEVA